MKAVTAVLDILRAKEATLALEQNDIGQLEGDVEIDEHAFRLVYISKSNPHYKKEIDEAIAKDTDLKNHSYFVAHLRAIAVRRRG